MDRMQGNDINRKRRAGVLLHPTSLPGELKNGDIGHEAYRFIEFLHTNGFRVWQMLPLGPTHDDKSPYQCLSSHAGNPNLISIDWLCDKGWLDTSTIKPGKKSNSYRSACLKRAAENFYSQNDKLWTEQLAAFIREHSYWLNDYALYVALKKQFDDTPWYDWPAGYRHRDRAVLDDASWNNQHIIKQVLFEQFIFFLQWKEVRNYARQHNVEIFGDMPIFVAHDSADAWVSRQNFLMDEDGNMPVIAGVPPDAFSSTGQRWGNPLYDWDYMRSTHYKWWKQRFKTQLELFDMIRIDHFRGLQACWQIPADDDTAMNGKWYEVPGDEMLRELYNSFNPLPLVAEDLGVITDEVIELKNSFSLPGMKVLQFAFDGNVKNPHLPHHHLPEDIVYTGTHDNDTTIGWASDKLNYNAEFLEAYAGMKLKSRQQKTWSLVKMALASVSFISIFPMQDILMLGSKARMNRPGTVGGNWQWRFDWQQLDNNVINEFTRLKALYER